MALKPQTTGGKVGLGAAIIVMATSFTTVGAAIIQWETLRPWMSESQVRAIADKDKELAREDAKLRRELAAEDKLIKTRACENTLARLQAQLFQAQANEVNAIERSVTLADTQARALNNKIILDAKEAQHTFEEQYDQEKKECGF